MTLAFEAARDGALLDALADQLGIALPDAARPALLTYLERVATWNEKLDLTAARNAQALCEVMLADALVLSDPALVPHAACIVDVGSGAGAPMVPLLALRPDTSGTLVEAKRKRVAFLRGVLGALGYASRAQVLEARLDPAALPFGVPSGHTLALSRATFAPAAWLGLGARLAPTVVVLVASEPLPPAPSGTDLHIVREYRLPDGERPRKIGVYRRGP